MRGIYLKNLTLFLLFLGLLFPCGECYATANAESGKVVALTFDDGPHPSHTNQILDILKKEEVKATFFVIGKNVELYPEPLLRAFREGHEIENHSYYHKTKGKSADSLKNSIETTSQLVEELIGYRPRFFRPPGGFATASVKTATGDLALRQVYWTIDAEDWMGKSAGAITRQVLSSAKGHEVVLFHDYMLKKRKQLACKPGSVLLHS